MFEGWGDGEGEGEEEGEGQGQGQGQGQGERERELIIEVIFHWFHLNNGFYSNVDVALVSV